MNRIQHHWQAEPVAAALGLIPTRIRHLLGEVPVLAGVDPAFAGLHFYDGIEDGTGRSYDSTMHVAYPVHQLHLPASARETTVVLPAAELKMSKWSLVASLVHELGHVLDERLGFTVDPAAIDDYAATNRCEAFACAFQAWVWGPNPRFYDRGGDPYEALSRDGRTVALLDALAD